MQSSEESSSESSHESLPERHLQSPVIMGSGESEPNEEQTIRLLEDDGSFEEFLRDHGIFEGDGLYDGLIHENELVGEGTALHAAQDPPCSRKTR